MKLEISEFTPYKGKHVVQFQSDHITLISGKSGAGKTTLFKAIEWCLMGRRTILSGSQEKKTRRGNATYVSMTWEASERPNGKELYIKRVKGNNKLVFREGDFEVQGVSAQEHIFSLFGSDVLWRSSSYIRQSELSAMLELSSKKEILLELEKIAYGGLKTCKDDIACMMPEEVKRRIKEAISEHEKRNVQLLKEVHTSEGALRQFEEQNKELLHLEDFEVQDNLETLQSNLDSLRMYKNLLERSVGEKTALEASLEQEKNKTLPDRDALLRKLSLLDEEKQLRTQQEALPNLKEPFPVEVPSLKNIKRCEWYFQDGDRLEMKPLILEVVDEIILERLQEYDLFQETQSVLNQLPFDIKNDAESLEEACTVLSNEYERYALQLRIDDFEKEKDEFEALKKEVVAYERQASAIKNAKQQDLIYRKKYGPLYDAVDHHTVSGEVVEAAKEILLSSPKEGKRSNTPWKYDTAESRNMFSERQEIELTSGMDAEELLELKEKEVESTKRQERIKELKTYLADGKKLQQAKQAYFSLQEKLSSLEALLQTSEPMECPSCGTSLCYTEKGLIESQYRVESSKIEKEIEKLRSKSEAKKAEWERYEKEQAKAHSARQELNELERHMDSTLPFHWVEGHDLAWFEAACRGQYTTLLSFQLSRLSKEDLMWITHCNDMKETRNALAYPVPNIHRYEQLKQKSQKAEEAHQSLLSFGESLFDLPLYETKKEARRCLNLVRSLHFPYPYFSEEEEKQIEAFRRVEKENHQKRIVYQQCAIQVKQYNLDLQTYHAYQKEYAQWQDVRKKKEAIEKRRQRLSTEIGTTDFETCRERTQALLRDCDTREQTLNQLENALETQRKKIEKIEEEMERLGDEETLQEAISKQMKYQQYLDIQPTHTRLTEECVSSNKKETDNRVRIEHFKSLHTLAETLETRMLEQIISDLNASMDEFSLTLFEEHETLLLTLVKQNTSNDSVRTSFDMYLMRGEETIPLDRLSGGERARASFVFMLALADLPIFHSSPLLMLDEFMGSLGFDLKEPCMELLRLFVQKHPHKSVLIIDPIPMHGLFDEVKLVEKAHVYNTHNGKRIE